MGAISTRYLAPTIPICTLHWTLTYLGTSMYIGPHTCMSGYVSAYHGVGKLCILLNTILCHAVVVLLSLANLTSIFILACLTYGSIIGSSRYSCTSSAMVKGLWIAFSCSRRDILFLSCIRATSHFVSASSLNLSICFLLHSTSSSLLQLV